MTADALERAGTGLDETETVAVTRSPGLIGALLVGVSSAKALGSGAGTAAGAGQPPARPRGGQHAEPDLIEPPYLCLVASGGHTFLAWCDPEDRYEVLGQMVDDAAGEAFDKGARLLGLGYLGGPEIDRLARHGDPEASSPRAAPARSDQLQRAEDVPALQAA